MGNIVLLDELTINKIAAGEVIERPASVIKEMVENSIDAGANNIIVEIQNGGISKIRITDNGKGIAEDDMEMAFERHATSKIRSADDLNTVTSMGFRGEALASIAAIARVEMISKTENQETGYRIVVEGGDIKEKGETGCPVGTTITVSNLFYNTPVRYKFLKKDYTEAGYIEDVITRIALVHPEISIKLINSGKTIIQTNGNGDLKTVVYSIYGKDVAGALIETNYTYEGIRVNGVIGKPEIARSNRANQLFFVNKRYIRDKLLSSATERAYKGMIPIGKFSFLVLNIDMDPSKVDVNVHPAKLEVRFEEENKVYKAIYHAIKDTLLKIELVADTDHTSSEKRSESGLFGQKTPMFSTENATNVENTTNSFINDKNQEVLRKLQQMKNRLMQGMPKREETMLQEVPEQKENALQELPKQEENALQELPKQEEKALQELPKQEENTLQEIPEQEENALQEIPEQEENTPQEVLEQEETMTQELSGQEETKVFKTIQEQPEEENTEITYKIYEEPEIPVEEEEIPYAFRKDKQEKPEFDEMYMKMFGTKPIQEDIKEQEEKNEIDDIATLGNTSVFDDIEEYQKPTYKFIGIVFKTYIIIEMQDDMYIIDQHAAHERILYEKVKQNYYNEETKDSQLMLLPDIITLSHKEMQIAMENMEMFKKAGFMVEEFGENTIKLTGVPEMCLDLETKEMFLETLDEINSISRTAKQEIEERFIATVACKAAVKANMALTKEEVDSLMDKLLALPNPFTCPHGRPTAIKMSKYDIERKFARK